jgi:FdhD protein
LAALGTRFEMHAAMQQIRTTAVMEWNAGEDRQVFDDVVVEEPLEIRVNGRPISVTMRTPGNDFDLAVGFLFTERLIANVEDIADLTYAEEADLTPSTNIVEVTLRPGKTIDPRQLERNFYAASSCGVCGKSSIAAVRVTDLPRPSRALRVDPDSLCGLPEALRNAQAVFDRTGGLHAAALFDANDATGAPLAIREDVGRHNAVDKIIGDALLAGRVPLSNQVMFVSGRGAFEIVQKSLVAGVPVLASVSAPSSLAVDLARDHGQTLIGFVRGRRFIVYAGPDRITPSAGGRKQESPR